MIPESIMPLVAVVIGGLLTIAGGFASTYLLEKQRQKNDSLNLAMAFKGEISALLQHMQDRRYAERFEEIIHQIETSRAPFYMPFRIRYAYDRVYENNVERIGLLKGRLPELIPLFYTQLNSVIEDLVNLGDGSYAGLDLDLLIRIYKDDLRLLLKIIAGGAEIEREINQQYNLP